MHSFSRRNDPHVAVHANRLIASVDIGVKYPTRTLALDSVGDRKVLTESDGVLSLFLPEADAVAGRASLGSWHACTVCARRDPIEKVAMMLLTRIDRILTWISLNRQRISRRNQQPDQGDQVRS
jgi:hypothetical protein